MTKARSLGQCFPFRYWLYLTHHSPCLSSKFFFCSAAHASYFWRQDSTLDSLNSGSFDRSNWSFFTFPNERPQWRHCLATTTMLLRCLRTVCSHVAQEQTG